MPVIELETLIAAPIERVFDLARSIDAHVVSASPTNERAVAGRTSGLLERGESVTWEAHHFLIRRRLEVKITGYDRPNFFEDVMVRGAFKKMSHQHRFSSEGEATKMVDRFEFSAPLGVLGWCAEKIFLTAHMRGFLEERNQQLKQMAESDRRREILEVQSPVEVQSR